MAKNWNYSEMTHEAKLHGGPEEYLEMIKEQSFLEGRIEGKTEGRRDVLITWFCVTSFTLLSYGMRKVYILAKDKYEKYKLDSKEEAVREAENRLIQGMERAIVEEDIEVGV